jgi:hypothetical protein
MKRAGAARVRKQPRTRFHVDRLSHWSARARRRCTSVWRASRLPWRASISARSLDTASFPPLQCSPAVSQPQRQKAWASPRSRGRHGTSGKEVERGIGREERPHGGRRHICLQHASARARERSCTSRTRTPSGSGAGARHGEGITPEEMTSPRGSGAPPPRAARWPTAPAAALAPPSPSRASPRMVEAREVG